MNEDTYDMIAVVTKTNNGRVFAGELLLVDEVGDRVVTQFSYSKGAWTFVEPESRPAKWIEEFGDLLKDAVEDELLKARRRLERFN